MSYHEDAGVCSHCNDSVLIRRRGPNHVLHLLLSMATVGLWLPVWLIVGVSSLFGSWHCATCGMPAQRA